MHQISRHLQDFDCWFSQIFADNAALSALIKHTAVCQRYRGGRKFQGKGGTLPAPAWGTDRLPWREKNQYDLVVNSWQ